MISLLEQLLRSKNEEGTSAQPPMEVLTAHLSHTPQNLEVNSVTKQHFIPIALIQLAQTLATVDLTTQGPFNDIFVSPMNYDK
jgi:hypothetical protein